MEGFERQPAALLEVLEADEERKRGTHRSASSWPGPDEARGGRATSGSGTRRGAARTARSACRRLRTREGERGVSHPPSSTRRRGREREEGRTHDALGAAELLELVGEVVLADDEHAVVLEAVVARLPAVRRRDEDHLAVLLGHLDRVERDLGKAAAGGQGEREEGVRASAPALDLAPTPIERERGTHP